jgi:large subunit ribosomal protein L14
MVQMETILKSADNSGAKLLKCIQVYGGTRKKHANLGEVISVSARSVVPNSPNKIKKGDKFLAVLVRSKFSAKHAGVSTSFNDTSVVVLNKDMEVIGTRIFGPVSSHLRSNPMFLKILSLASEVF